MKSKLIHQDRQRTYAIVFDIGDEVMEGLRAFAREHDLQAAQFTGIGAFSEVTLGYFDWDSRDYEEIPILEQVEVLTLAGDVAVKGDEPQVHAHVAIGKRDGSAHGGHLMRARVRPTLEVILVESPGHMRKRVNEDVGVALIDLDDPS
jgi:predicted DNA-binding protein with PD1-like motif